MLRLLTLLATASCVIAAPFDIANLASSKLVNSDSITAAPAIWKRIVTEAPWSARAGGSLQFDPATQKFVLHGVGIYDQDDEALEEVWIGTMAGRFTQVNVRTPFEPLYSALSTQDINGVQYRIQGSDNANNAYPDVYRSADDGKNWVAQHLSTKSKTPLEGTRFLGAAVALVTTPSTLLVWGGQSSSSEILSDVWRSTDAGINWKFVVDTAAPGKYEAFGARSVHSGLATSMTYEGETIDVVYHFGGYIAFDPKVARGVYGNDIWISTGSYPSIGLRWNRIQSTAPWTARGNAQVSMTSNGVLVVFGGISGYSYDGDYVLNDVWASLDGGYSFGLCSAAAEFSDRVYQQAGIDSEGYLWVMGGRDVDGSRVNDIWKSAQSYNDVEGVAQQCNLLVPSCGAGLKCLPGSSGFRSGLWGVACDACPNGPCKSLQTDKNAVTTTNK